MTTHLLPTLKSRSEGPLKKPSAEAALHRDPSPQSSPSPHGLGYLVAALPGLREPHIPHRPSPSGRQRIAQGVSPGWGFVGIVSLIVFGLLLGAAAPTEAQLFGKKKQDQRGEKPYEPTPKIEKNLEKGHELMEAGELDKAQHRFEKALDLSVLEEPRAFLALAELNLRRERWEAAAKMAGRTRDVTDDPEVLAEAEYLRGLGYLRWFQELSRGEPEAPPSKVILERAAESLRYTIAQGGEQALDAHLRLAAVYELGDQPEEARRLLAEYLERQDPAAVPAEVRDLERRLEAGGGVD